jgi:OOP family OmpA-OmpF porin
MHIGEAMDLASLGTSEGMLDTISRFAGGEAETTRKTMHAAIPTTMLALAEHGSTEIGAGGLLAGLRSGEAPQLDVADLPLSDPEASEKLLNTSSAFLDKTLGGKLQGIIGALSSHGGADRAVTSKLVALAAPLALGVIGRHAREHNLDAKGLAAFLAEQKPKVATMLPAPLRSLVGGEQIREIAPQRAHVQRPLSPWVWALPLLAALFGIGWLLGRSVHAPHVQTPITQRLPPQATVPPVSGVATRSMQPVEDFLASGRTAPRRFSFEGLTFAPGGTQLSPEGEATARELAAALRAHPPATVRVEGYGDAELGRDANRELSQARADSVKQALIADGVSADRIEASALNDGRNLNRRVEVLIRTAQ